MSVCLSAITAMKILMFLIFVSYFSGVQLKDIDRYAYCESCITTAQDMTHLDVQRLCSERGNMVIFYNIDSPVKPMELEIEKTLKEVTVERRQAVIENLFSGEVCKKLQTNKNDVSKDKMTMSCRHLLDSHHEKFREALVSKEPKNLDIVLCYEQSTACSGVKRHSFQDSTSTFTERDIEALLQQNKEIVRIAKPTHSGSPVSSRDEL